jgi:OPA family sugar phosphate sensor protein UhpC-like MFS transporter
MRGLQVRVFALTWLSYASFYLTRKDFSVVKGRLEEEMGLTLAQLGMIDTLYLAAYALGQFVSGSLGDRFGPRRLLAGGMIGSAACAALFGVSSLFIPFLVAFAVNGLFQSTGWSNNVAAMAPWFGRKVRGLVMGFWATNYQVGGLLATALAGWLLVHYGWRSAFLVPAVWVAGVGALLLFFLVERPQDAGLPPVEDEEHPPEIASAAASAELAPAGPSGMRRMLANPIVWALGASYFCIKLIRYSLLFWLPYYLHKRLGYAEDVAAYLSTAFEAGGIVGVIAVGWVSDRFFSQNRARLIAPTLLALAVALAAYRLVGEWGMAANAISMGVVGFLLFGPDALLSGAAAQDIGGRDAAASAAGIINGLGSIGAILQGVVTATISEAYGWDALFYVFVLTATVAALAVTPLALRRQRV